MPATKENTAVFTAQALAGGGGPTNSGFVNLRTAYGGEWHIKVTNGISRLAKGVQVQVEVAPDQVAGNESPFDCRQVAAQEANAVTRFPVVRVPPEANFTRIVVTHGDAAATIDAIFTRLSQV